MPDVARQILTWVLIVPMSLGLVASAGWLIRRGQSAWLPPPLRDRFVRWGLAEIILAFSLIVLVPVLVFQALQSLGFFHAIYGQSPVDPKSDLFSRCAILWAGTIAVPLQVLGALALVRCVSGTRLQQLGLRRRRIRPGVAAGFAAWLLVAPPVFSLHFLVVAIQDRILHWPIQKHPLEQLLLQQSSPAEWLLLVLQAVLFAPIWEELLFRGLLLPRLAKHAWGGQAAWVAAAMLAALPLLDQRLSWSSAAPLMFVLLAAVAGALLTVRETGPYWRWRAILGSATLFAALHTNAWPTPIPLLFLGIALGWLAERTRGLIAPMVLHGLFNAISTLALLQGWIAGA